MFSASIQYLEYDIAWKAFIELRKAGERKGKKKYYAHFHRVAAEARKQMWLALAQT